MGFKSFPFLSFCDDEPATFLALLTREKCSKVDEEVYLP